MADIIKAFTLMVKVFLTMAYGVIVFTSLCNLIDEFCVKGFNLKTLLRVLLLCAFAAVSIVGVWLSWGIPIKIVITIGLLTIGFVLLFSVRKELIAYENENAKSDNPEIISYMQNNYSKDKMQLLARYLFILLLFCLLIVGIWIYL
ncbi:MAG: hypothetical protein QM203_06065 [Bacillota bacterium]|nr:hypothetical protein [Bacillota bacterium]